MTAQESSDCAAIRRHLLLYVTPFLLVLICGGLYIWLAGDFPPHPRRFLEVGEGPNPDATTLISTLVVIYTFFAAAYGALAPSLVGKDRRTPTFGPAGKEDRAFWRAAALVYILLAVSLDLVRVWNSIGDLYTTTMRELPPDKVYDAAAEFTRYLIVNAFVFLFVLAIAFWPEPQAATSRGRRILDLIRKLGHFGKPRGNDAREQLEDA
jgi:hypothetical protein